MQNLTKEHNETDFTRIKEIADKEWSLEDARAQIKTISEKAERQVERHAELKKGHKEVCSRIDYWREKSNSYREELNGKDTEIKVMSANVNTKYFENLYLKDQVERLTQDRDKYKQETIMLTETVRGIPAEPQKKNGCSR